MRSRGMWSHRGLVRTVGAVVGVFVTVGGVAWTTRSASACPGCPEPGPRVDRVFGPADGGSYPANGAVFMEGDMLSVENATATVAGVDATLVRDLALEGEPRPSGMCPTLRMAVRVEPPPEPGDEVVLDGSFAADPEGFPGEPLTHSYTAIEPDLDPPPTITRLIFNLFDPNPGESMCFDVPELAWYVHLEFDGPANSGATPEFVVVEAYEDETTTEPVRTRSIELPDDGTVLFQENTQLADPRHAFCFRAWTFDGAGSVTEPTPLVCLPCYERRQPPGETTSELDFEEPEWEDWERVPGGPCDDGNIPPPPDDTGTNTADETGSSAPGTGAPGDTESSDPNASDSDASDTDGQGADDDGSPSTRGCACSSVESPSHHRGFAGLLVLALVAARRREIWGRTKKGPLRHRRGP